MNQISRDGQAANRCQDNPLARLQLATRGIGPAQAWLYRIRTAPDFQAASRARHEATVFVAGLEQRRDVTCGQADRLFEVVDGEWRECLKALENQRVTLGDCP